MRAVLKKKRTGSRYAVRGAAARWRAPAELYPKIARALNRRTLGIFVELKVGGFTCDVRCFIIEILNLSLNELILIESN